MTDWTPRWISLQGLKSSLWGIIYQAVLAHLFSLLSVLFIFFVRIRFKKTFLGGNMSDIVKGSLGPESTYDVSFAGGALIISANYKGAQASAGLNVSISGAQLIEALAAKLSNPTEKALLNGLASIIAAIP